jgi:hypothetical protein
MAGMEELPRDFTKMFDYDVFKFDVDLIPQAKVISLPLTSRVEQLIVCLFVC